ncbi:CBS domain-containing protein [Poseidonocella sedimentorum]|uniref:CBS domain-containing protein n=1 Tax=Poseidonocella sedimentorum TaxID=871652 RepID=A0A1I6E4A6_9RHOB|nr:CBS domain-containing protein [Poseidonocella sedimentorum]SFR12585.1 CBS domain-containing protein [Poseidonocella sedimentorum]
MPASYQAPSRKDKSSDTTYSQSAQTNTSAETANVQKILQSKDKAVFSIRPQQTIHDAVEILRDKRIGALLVMDAEGHLVGILSERDIVRKLADTPGKTLPNRVEDVMTRDVEVCTPDEPLLSVLRRMTAGRFRHMPVAADNGVVGIVTIGDVVNFRLKELEHEALQLKQLIVG